MAQLLSNLIGNAVKHGAPDGPISVRASGSADQVRVEVHNLGHPIPPEQRLKLFEPLTRGALQENPDPAIEPSVGLGLYIASEVAKAHGGEVQLSSSDEHGTTFSLLLSHSSSPR
jgi:signal transduction histidine kinase